jgi:aminoglycoside/choline kinase family phosphotransferase
MPRRGRGNSARHDRVARCTNCFRKRFTELYCPQFPRGRGSPLQRSYLMQTELLLHQTRRHLPEYGAGEIDIDPIEKGGSDRRFYRVRCAGEQSLILVKYDLRREENRHYVDIAHFLAVHRIRAPRIYFHDPSEGLIWIEDLGEEDLYSFRKKPWSVRQPLYQTALDEIVKLHEVPETDWAQLAGQMPAEFNAALYEWEQRYFFDNCLGRIFGLDQPVLANLAALTPLHAIAEHLATLPRVLVHRDFQSQNIIFRDGRPYLIDFQGMRPGLAGYDLASLIFDPYVKLTADERHELSSYYLEQSTLGGEARATFHDTLRLCAMQRLMQALGAYGFLGLVKGNRHFLAHVPAALAALREVISGIKGLEPLGAALASLREDAVVTKS